VKRFLWPLGIFAALVIVLLVGLKHAPEKGVIKSPLIGKAAPEFKVPLLTDGTQHFETAALKGGWHLVNIWGTWCFECRNEHATLLAIKSEGKIPIIGIDWRDEDTAAMQWLSQLGNPYETVAADRDGRVAIDWGVYGAPESFLVNPEGVIVEKQVGAMTIEDWQSRFLPHLTAGANAIGTTKQGSGSSGGQP
jgi:cytochrome c biogenesis protein CcmG, thiol:disulfide interchange protein DsbE